MRTVIEIFHPDPLPPVHDPAYDAIIGALDDLTDKLGAGHFSFAHLSPSRATLKRGDTLLARLEVTSA